MNIAVSALNADTQAFDNPYAFLRQVESGVKPSVMALSYGLVGVDTLDLLRVLRAHKLIKNTPCIVVLGPQDSEELRQQVLDAGATEVVRRTMTTKALNALLTEFMREASISQLTRSVVVNAA